MSPQLGDNYCALRLPDCHAMLFLAAPIAAIFLLDSERAPPVIHPRQRIPPYRSLFQYGLMN